MTRRRLRRVVVKVGSGLIADPIEGPDRARIEPLAAEIAGVMAGGVEVALVTSGAIAAGTARLGLGGRPRSIPEKQAAAAVGQAALMWHYEQACGGARRPGRPGAAHPGGREPSRALSERPEHADDAPRLQGAPGDQRERHGRGRGDQGRRQRQPRRAGGGLDRRRPPRAPLRHRRALHGRPAPRSRRAADRARGDHHARDGGAGGGGRAGRHRRHGDEAPGRAEGDGRGDPAWSSRTAASRARSLRS